LAPFGAMTNPADGAATDFYISIGGIDRTPTTGSGVGGALSEFYQSQTTGVALPVELVNLTAMANGRTIDLTWATKTEVNNYGFDVERQAINADKSTSAWAKVGFVEGNGTSNTQHNYSYNDVVSAAGSFNYRLKQTDKDGKFTYSSVVEANATLTAADYQLSQNYPNPFNPTTKFNFAVKTSENVSVRVYNALGQEVVSLFDGVVPADQIQSVTFDGSRLASGMYFYVLRAKDRVEIKKMLMIK
ncbi:MAG TPA: T9SS type A sorting domain-containing protein, partial [Bacteroidota bacterium]|nr:T9SS type A sorting domain-containing protein [Bacteroidota bacterium]